MMQEETRTKAELLNELSSLRKRISKLEQANQTLRHFEQKWRSLAENAPNFIIVTDSNGTIEFINRTMSGFGTDRTLGRTIYDFLERAYYQTAKNALKRVFQKGQPTKYEAQVTVPGDRTYWVETHVGPIKHDGKVTAAALISTDITPRKKAAEALRQSQETTHAFFDAIPDTAVLMDAKANILAINRAGADRLGRSVDEIVGKNCQDIFPADVFELRRSMAAKVVRTGKMIRYEDKRAGLYFETCICPVFDAQGTVQRLAAFARDITERKKAEDELRSQEGLLRNIVSNIPHSIFWKSRNSVYLGCNYNFAKTAGVENPADVIGKTDYDLPWRKEEADFYRKIDQQVMAKGSPILNLEETVHDASGRSATILTSKVPLRNVDGEIIAILGIYTDITERKKAAAEIRRLSSAVEQSIEGIAIGDLQPKLTFVNEAFARMHGYTRDEMLGMEVVRLHNEQQMAEYNRAMAQIKTHGLWKGEIGHIRKDGTAFPTYMSVSLLKNEQGQATGMVAVAQDITDRKKQEQALKIRDRAMSSSINGIAIADPQGNLTYVNNSFLKMWGYDEEDQVLGEHSTAFWQQEDKAADVIRALNKTGSWIGELTALSQDNSTFDVQISASAVQDEQGNLICMMASFIDVTERKKAHEALRESEEKFRTFVETAADLMHIADKDLNITDVNEAMAKTLGYSKQEMIGMCATEIISAESLERDFKPNWERYLADGEISIQTNFVTKDGREIPGEIKVVAFYDNNGEYAGARAVFHDITERKRYEEALAESEENFRAIFDNATDGIVVADPKTTKYITGNRMICRMLGYTLDELKNLQVKDIHPEGSLKDDLRKFEKVLNRQITLSEDVPVKRKDGSIFYADINTAFLRFGGKECLMGIFRDITEHKQAELRLEGYREEMAQAERLASLGTLSATLAHELTQPLTVVRLSIENALADLEKASCPASTTEQLKDSLAEISHTVSIIDRLRNFARKSSKEDITEVDLETIADRIVVLLDASARRAPITLCLKDLDKLPPMFANEKDLEQLFFALVENAIHAADGKKNRRLTIGATAQGRQIELRFSDNCSGIAPKNLDKIFDPFFTTKSAGEGTGLGLCIVQRIVSHAGGKIRVESKTGKGTTFSITLPINKAGRS